MGVRLVSRAVVGHDALHPHAAGPEPGDRATQEADRGQRLLVGEHLEVGQSAVVVDADVHELIARGLLEATWAAAEHAVPWPPEAAELLDVDVHELARALALVAVGWFGRLESRALAEPNPLEDRRY